MRLSVRDKPGSPRRLRAAGRRATNPTARAPGRGRWLFALAGAAVAVAVAVSGYVLLLPRDVVLPEAPEAQRILDVQAGMPFQILIPAYLPRDFDRAAVEVKVDELGPGGEPMVQLAYRTRRGAVLYVREWVPVNPDKEILAASRPVQTKWGSGWLLSQGESLGALWVDIGPLRASIYTQHLDVVSREGLLHVGESLGPASGRQVFNFVVERTALREVAPPPPKDVPVSAEGVQDLTLVVTPGGYDPVRFAVKKGVPVRLTFRQLGQVGCGNELIFAYGSGNTAGLLLRTPTDRQVLEFTPQEAGRFEFHCSHVMYRGHMYVKD